MVHLPRDGSHLLDLARVRLLAALLEARAGQLSSYSSLAGGVRVASALLKTEHAFQVVQDLPYVDADSFGHHDPIRVPALTWLSQLI